MKNLLNTYKYSLLFICFIIPFLSPCYGQVVTCGNGIDITNIGGSNNIQDYPLRPGFTFSAPEGIYSFTPTTSGVVCISMINRSPAANVDAFVLTDPTDASSNILWLNGFPGYSSCFQAVAGNEYFLVVDGLGASVSTLTINIDCTSGGNLDNDPIECSTGLSLTNDLGLSNTTEYSVRSGVSYSGPEGVYPLPVGMCGQVCFSITDRDPDFPVDLFVLTDRNDPATSILRVEGFVGNEVCFDADPDKDYFLVVDGLFSVSTLGVDITCTRCNVPEPIPTLGEWGLICLGLLLIIFGVQSIKQHRSVISY